MKAQPFRILALATLTIISLAAVSGAAWQPPDAGAAPAAPQAVVVLTADADATVWSASRDANYGGASTLDVIRSVLGARLFESRTLVHFNPSSLPPFSAIDSARLELYQTSSILAESVAVTAFQAAAAWTEGSVTWNTQPAVYVPGAEVTLDETNGWKSWDVTAMARVWLSTSTINFGISLRGPSGGLFGRTFSSREGANQPRLRVTYHDALCELTTQIPRWECDALVALYNSAGGPGWAIRTNWLATLTPCSWYGVTCEAGHVTILDLERNLLSGSIPPQLGDLANLKSLHLDSNQLSGVIPYQLGSLSKLEYLYLTGNQLSGAIPPQLGNLANLKQLALETNQLSGAIPPQLGSLANLICLWLGDNRLSGAIPPELGNLPRLESLTLDSNQLSGAIPASLCNPLYQFYTWGPLNLAYNALTSGPACIVGDDSDWRDTQTVPPTNLHAALSGAKVQLTWTPILYTAHGGYYEVFYAMTPGGALTQHGATANKSATGYLAGSLSPGTTYYFKVRTYTPAHGEQQNALTSIWSAEVPVTTPAGPTPTPKHRLRLPLILQ